MTGTRKWFVQWVGDPDYGRDKFSPDEGAIVDAIDATSAVRSFLAELRRDQAREVREEGWYGEGTAIAVQEKVDPPPVKTFVVQSGRLKLERSFGVARS